VARRSRPIKPVKTSARLWTRAGSTAGMGRSKIRRMEGVKTSAHRPVKPRAAAVKHSQALARA